MAATTTAFPVLRTVASTSRSSQSADDGLVGHIERVGLALQRVVDVAGVESGVLGGAYVGGLMLFGGIGYEDVIG